MTQPLEHPVVAALIAMVSDRSGLTQGQVRAIFNARHALISAPGLAPSAVPQVADRVVPGLMSYPKLRSLLRQLADYKAAKEGTGPDVLLAALGNAPELDDPMTITAVAELDALADTADRALRDRLRNHVQRTGRTPQDVRLEFTKLHAAASVTADASADAVPADDVLNWLDGAPPDHATTQALLALSRREPLTLRGSDGRYLCVVCGATYTDLHGCGAEFERGSTACPQSSCKRRSTRFGCRTRNGSVSAWTKPIGRCSFRYRRESSCCRPSCRPGEHRRWPMC